MSPPERNNTVIFTVHAAADPHRHQEFIRFLNRIDRQTLPYLDIHLIIDNYATHKRSCRGSWSYSRCATSCRSG